MNKYKCTNCKDEKFVTVNKYTDDNMGNEVKIKVKETCPKCSTRAIVPSKSKRKAT